MKNIFCLLVCLLTLRAQANFTDTQNYDWQESINYLTDQGLVKGYPDGSFKPQQTINRAEFTKIVMIAAFEYEDTPSSGNCFTDVSGHEWFAPFVCNAQAEGIINGYPDSTFRPAANINQAEALKILYETFYQNVDEDNNVWYQKYLDAAESDGLLYFEPKNPAAHLLTRGQMAYFMAWILDEDGLLENEISFEYFYGEDWESADFGWETMTPDDCFEDEYFDDVDEQCYWLEDEYDYENEEDFYTDDDFANFDIAHTNPSSQQSVVYQVDKDQIVLTQNQAGKDKTLNNADYHQLVWQRFTQLIPSQNRNQITQVLFFNDAQDSTAAYVEPQDDTLTTWILGINLDGLFDHQGKMLDSKELDLTLIHEFAHVMTLNHTQVDPNITEDACKPQFYTGEGCASATAFINLFFKKFWNQKMYQTVLNDPDFGPQELYDNAPHKFVTDYAASNPGEDIAESFAYFVVKAKPQNCELNGKSQKLCFMHQQPSLATLRKNIRQALK